TELERGGAGMRCLSLDRDLQPPGSLNPLDDADGNIGALQGWSLLDMKFEVTGYRKSERAHRSLRQRVQRGLQVVAEQFPVIASKRCPAVGDRAGGESHRTHAARLIATAFLVHPGHSFHSYGRLDAGILQCFQNLEGGQRSEHAVKASTGNLAVEMAAHQE